VRERKSSCILDLFSTLKNILFKVTFDINPIYTFFSSVETKQSKAIHEGTIPDISELASSIKKTTLAHAAAWKSSSAQEVEAWSPPQKGFHKINFNTGRRDQFSAQAAVCGDHKGAIIKAISQINPPCTPNLGEALAASLAVSLNLKNFTIEVDSLMVITALQHPTIIQDWHIEKVNI
jgi:predicted dinucleotide-binding enzyme